MWKNPVSNNFFPRTNRVFAFYSFTLHLFSFYRRSYKLNFSSVATITSTQSSGSQTGCHDTFMSVAKILQCVAKIENYELSIIFKFQKQSITAITLKVFADGDLLTAFMLLGSLCTKENIVS
jgi:hypothetical protein